MEFPISLQVDAISPLKSLLRFQQNEHRFYEQLDGLWTFVMEETNSIGIGLLRKWHLYDLSKFYVGFFAFHIFVSISFCVGL